MAGKLILATTVAIVLSTAPGWAISTVTMPTSNDTARYTDPANKPQKPVNGTTTNTFNNSNTGLFGLGGSFSLSVGSTPQYPGQMGQPIPGTPFSNPAFQNTNRAFSNFPTDGAAEDPTFGPNGAYAPQFNNKR